MEQKITRQQQNHSDIATRVLNFGCRVVLLGAISLLAIHVSTGQAFMTKNGHAEFKSRVPLHSFIGVSDDLVGAINLADSTIDFYIDLTTLKTGIGKRDKDMRITLETNEFPFAEFYGKMVTPFDPESEQSQEIQVAGVFTLHGVSKDISVTATLEMHGDELHVSASWKLNLRDYNIKPPRLLIIKVDEVQELSVSGRLTSVSN